MRLSTRHILSINDLTKKDVLTILATASSFKEISERPIKKVPTLRGRTVINCFFEDSTRTRLSFELAEKRLSADSSNISKSGSAMANKGETLLDTVRNIEAMRPDILVIRHSVAGAPAQAAGATRARIINAGDGMHEHPTQALLDLMTINDVKGRMKGLKVGIVGDILHSRVARSDMLLFKKMGLEVTVAGPPTLIPFGVEEAFGVRVASDVRDVLPELDVLMLLRVQRERLGEHFFPSAREYARYFGICADDLKSAKEDLAIMHPGPVNRGVEIAADVADGPRSVILGQVTCGVAVRMAVLYLLLGETHSE
ncbi:MAG: aspartate carbamoyltransferase catalytic subunit [Proteobacteria bacterium]|nr:aspartate carbamoyltransferase catalytic subunit [Pseudomonadota bacterium]